jgi:hypothetical protein
LVDGTTRENTATVVLEDAVTFYGYADVDFATADVTYEDESVDVEDNFNDGGYLPIGTATGDTVFEYSRTFDCDLEGENPNTARIVDPEETDDALVTVSCDALLVTKTATTTLNRRWVWDIEKTVDPESFLEGTFDESTNTGQVQATETLEVDYDIVVDTVAHVDSAWAVTGQISVLNQNTIAGMVNEPTDTLTGGISATVENCEIGGNPVAAFPVSLAGGATLICDYSAELPNANSRTNYASTTLVDLTDIYEGTAAVSFAAATITDIDECVDVTDFMDDVDVDPEDLGTVCITDVLPAAIVQTRTFGPEDITLEACEANVFHNTATATTNDTGSEVDDDETITLEVPCEEGCTLTQGYWKTHNQSFRDARNGHGPQPDPTWDLLGDADGDGTAEGEDETFYLSGMTWFEVFNTAPKGNVYYNLAHQYMAAVLNILAGASDDAVAAAMVQAEAFFESTTPAAAAGLKGNAKNTLVNLAGTLADFNEGDIGPGHCTENEVDN